MTEISHDTEWLQSRVGERICIRIPAIATNGAYSVTEVISLPGDSTSIHIHHNEEEHFLMLEGKMKILCGEETFEALPGMLITIHRGVAHAWGNASNEPVRMLIVFTPAGFEEVLRQIAIAGPAVDLRAMAVRFGFTIIGPRLLG
jgi:mannose-6-phosphate isomerase-like protein (cupin superfamily)